MNHANSRRYIHYGCCRTLLLLQMMLLRMLMLMLMLMLLRMLLLMLMLLLRMLLLLGIPRIINRRGVAIVLLMCTTVDVDVHHVFLLLLIPRSGRRVILTRIIGT